MTVVDGKIVKATDGELYTWYLKSGWENILDYEEYKQYCKRSGTEITDENEKS